MLSWTWRDCWLLGSVWNMLIRNWLMTWRPSWLCRELEEMNCWLWASDWCLTDWLSVWVVGYVEGCYLDSECAGTPSVWKYFFLSKENQFCLLQYWCSEFVFNKVLFKVKKKKNLSPPGFLTQKHLHDCCGLRAVRFNNEELSLKGKGQRTGQGRDRRQYVSVMREGWSDGLSDRRRWQQTSGAEKLQSAPEDYLPWHLSASPLWVFSQLLHVLSTFILAFWLTWLSLSLLHLLLSFPCINPLFCCVSPSLPPRSLWGLFCTESQ